MTRTIRRACALMCLTALTGLAPGQTVLDRDKLPPQAKEVSNPPRLQSYILFALLLGAAVVANAIPSKRGHQD
ncbi:MAG: hypothetical protein H6811_03245 [Phycisphaeraceae bacterium]|nr:hypothetical protein [Phycisphaeraceae bacterium]